MARALVPFLVFFIIPIPASGPSLPVRPPATEVVVYFVGEADEASTLVLVPRHVRARDLAGKLRGAYLALLQGPTPDEQARGLGTEIPRGTKLRALMVTGDAVVAVDFSADLERGGGASSMQGRVWQIVYTGTQFPPVSRVRILIEGRAPRTLGGEGLILTHPLARPRRVPTF